MMKHPLDGCWAKIERAEENIQNLNREVNAFLSQDPKPYKIVGQHQNNGREYVFVAFGEVDVPLRISVLAGEIIHHLRSSLDHLIHALIVKNGGTPTNNNKFPICTTTEIFEEACNSGLIKGVSRSAKKLIRSVQPYTSRTPDNTILYVINQYDIFDKHKLLIIVATLGRIGERITLSDDEIVLRNLHEAGQASRGFSITGFSDPAPRKVTKDGVPIFSVYFAEPTFQVKADADFVFQIAFEISGWPPYVPVSEGLAQMLTATRMTIEMFSGEF